MIVKCQKSLSTTLPTSQMMFYGFGHKPMLQIDVTPDWSKLFKKWGPRFFAEVTWTDHTKPPAFIRKRGEQYW